MKTLYTLIISTFLFSSVQSQNMILNGSFEQNTATGNTNLNNNWPNVVADSWEIDGGNMNLDTSFACGTASNGQWFVTNCPGCPPSFYVAFSFGLTTPIIQGQTYTLSFDKNFCGDSTPIEFGISNDSTILDAAVHTFAGPTTQGWVHDSYTFQAPITAKFVMISINVQFIGGGLIGVDNFKLTPGACSAYYTIAPDVAPHTWIATNFATGAAPITYNWNWGDGGTSTGITPSHTYATAGNYPICLSIADANGCVDTYCDSSTYLYRLSSGSTMVSVNVIDGITGITSPESMPDYFISPNPFQNKISIQTGNKLSDSRVEIYSLSGQKIKSEKLNGVNTELNTEEFAAGIYCLKILDGKNEMYRTMIVKRN